MFPTKLSEFEGIRSVRGLVWFSIRLKPNAKNAKLWARKRLCFRGQAAVGRFAFSCFFAKS